MHRIIEAVVTEITGERSSPRVFLLDGEGQPTVWPAGSSEALPAELVGLLRAYFAQDASGRGLLTDLIEIDGTRMTVRIVPYRAADANRYAVTVERFAVRATV